MNVVKIRAQIFRTKQTAVLSIALPYDVARRVLMNEEAAWASLRLAVSEKAVVILTKLSQVETEADVDPENIDRSGRQFILEYLNTDAAE